MMGDNGVVKTYWLPMPLKEAENKKYGELRKSGQLYVLRRDVSLFKRCLRRMSPDCNIQAAFESATKEMVMLLSDKTDDIYLREEQCELKDILDYRKAKREENQLLKLPAPKMPSLEEALQQRMGETKKKLHDKMTLRGMVVDDIRYAHTERMQLSEYMVAKFLASVDRILDKYWIEPD